MIEIGSKTAEKNSAQTNKQTDRQTNRHYESNGHLAVNQKLSFYDWLRVSLAESFQARFWYIFCVCLSVCLSVSQYVHHTLITSRMSCRRREMYCSHARLCVCLSVWLSADACPHYCTDPDVTWGVVGDAPNCALLGGFAIGARVALLWQHNPNAKLLRVHACTRSVPSWGVLVVNCHFCPPYVDQISSEFFIF